MVIANAKFVYAMMAFAGTVGLGIGYIIGSKRTDGNQ